MQKIQFQSDKARFGGHKEGVSFYGEEGVNNYANKERPDGKALFDRFVEAFIENHTGKEVVDLGCGPGGWALVARAKGSEHVYGIDIQPEMIRIATSKAWDAEVDGKISFVVGDVNNLNCKNDFFDTGMSINVACNLKSMSRHFEEMSRVVKGDAIITSPASLDVVFTDGTRSIKAVEKSIDKVLKKIVPNDPESVVEHLSTLTEVYSATFYKDSKEGKLKLLTKDTQLKTGTKIWRKLPANVLPNFYHTETEYISELTKAGFTIASIEKPKFETKNALEKYNKDNESGALGDAYIKNHPYVIYEVKKAPPSFVAKAISFIVLFLVSVFGERRVFNDACKLIVNGD